MIERVPARLTWAQTCFAFKHRAPLWYAYLAAHPAEYNADTYKLRPWYPKQDGREVRQWPRFLDRLRAEGIDVSEAAIAAAEIGDSPCPRASRRTSAL